MRPPLAHISLHNLRLYSSFSSRLFTVNAIKRYSTLPSPPPPPPPGSIAPPAGEKPYFITTPIFYVNAAPHVGHLYTTVIADVIKRWQRLLGCNALLCTGTDEHGMKVQQAAQLADKDPQEFCNEGANSFKSLANQAFCSYDTFIRTTNPEHYDAVQYFWQMLRARDYIYQGKHEGWYSVSDETFYPASAIEHTLDQATGQKIVISRETGRVVEWTSETNYHFRLSAMAPKLLEFYKQNPAFVVPSARYAEVVAAVEKGLDDLSVSRPRERLTWGIPVPNDDSQTIYVWLDALINYITATNYPWTPGFESAGGWPADVHIVGKDIVKFHAIYWPAFLLALDLPLPKQILTHAHWTMSRKKMSKSDGNVVNPFYAIQRYGVDTMRFYMAHDGGINDDRDYSNEQIVERYRHELQFGLGNLTNRVCGQKFDIVQACQESTENVWSLDTRDRLMMAQATSAAGEVAEMMEALDVPNALKTIMSLVHETNKYIQHAAPWTLTRDNQLHDQNKTVFLSSECIRIAGIMLQPFMPIKSKAILDQLAVDKNKRTFEFSSYGKDITYGQGTKGKKGLVFPPLSEWELVFLRDEKKEKFVFKPWKNLSSEQRVVLKRGGSIRDADGNETKVEKEDAKLLVRTVHARTKQEMKYQDKKNKWLGKLHRWGKRMPKEERKPAVWHKEKETKKEVKEVETPVVKAKVSVPLSPAIQKKDMEEKEWKALSEMLEERTAKLEKLKQEEERMTRMERVSGKGRRSKEKAWRKKRKGSEAAEEEKSNWRWL